MTKTYCIFRVYDYKGGELSSNVNLSHDSFIGYLAESFENTLYDLIQDKATRRDKKIDSIINDESETYKKTLKEAIIKDLNKGFYSTYAGGDGFVGELYCIENNQMKSVTHRDYVDEIVDYIDKNWN